MREAEGARLWLEEVIKREVFCPGSSPGVCFSPCFPHGRADFLTPVQ